MYNFLTKAYNNHLCVTSFFNNAYKSKYEVLQTGIYWVVYCIFNGLNKSVVSCWQL